MFAGWACEVTKILTKESTKTTLLCEDKSDLTSATSNQIPDIHQAVCVV